MSKAALPQPKGSVTWIFNSLRPLCRIHNRSRIDALGFRAS